MKKILIVDVPDSAKDLKPSLIGFENGDLWYRADADKIKEFIPPTEEEQDKFAIDYCNKEIELPACGDYTYETELIDIGINHVLSLLQ